MEPVETNSSNNQPEANPAHARPNERPAVNYLIPLSIIIAGALIAAGIYLGGMRTAANQPLSASSNQGATGTPQDIQLNPVTPDDHILGNPNAKVVMVEYSDLECPFCKAFQTTLHQIMNKYGANGDVAWVYRHFPLTELHPKAPKEAEAAECANEQGGNDKFWQFVDGVYAVTPSNNGLDPSELPKIAGQIGLNVDAFNTCLNSGKYADKVAAERADAIKAGGQGTPYTILVTAQGKLPISQGAISYDELSSLIDQLLAGSK